MTPEEIKHAAIVLKNEIKKYILDTPHWIVYWIANKEIKELINEYPNDYEDRVSIEVSSIDVNPSIQINFDGHPCEINYITRFCNLSNFRKEVEKKWSELEGNINEYRIKELQYDLEYHKRNVEEIEKMIKSLQK